jgi:hypothetical protein
VLNEIYTLREDLVRVNTGGTEAGPGYDHAHVLVYDVPLAGAITPARRARHIRNPSPAAELRHQRQLRQRRGGRWPDLLARPPDVRGM